MRKIALSPKLRSFD